MSKYLHCTFQFSILFYKPYLFQHIGIVYNILIIISIIIQKHILQYGNTNNFFFIIGAFDSLSYNQQRYKSEAKYWIHSQFITNYNV